MLILTGSPGVGKTTVLMKTVEALKKRGYSVGGMVSREVREGGVRVGFEIVDVNSSRSGWLAHVNQKAGPQVGKYRVNIRDLEDIGAEAIVNAVEACDIVAIDEIGPMELFSLKFKEAARKALDSSKLVIAVVHEKTQDILPTAAKSQKDSETFVVTHANREKFHENLLERAIMFLKQ